MTQNCSPIPWSYEYSPYRLHDGGELPAYEVFDDHGNKVFDTNEDSPAMLQEANAMLGAAAPALWVALRECIRLLAVHKDGLGDESDAYRQGILALSLCPLTPTTGD